MNEQSNKSKGLIITVVIIALVIVAGAVATPIILKNAEKDRRSEDVKVAQEIADSVLKDASSAQPTIVVGSPVEANPDTVPNMATQPLTPGDAVEKGIPFTYYYVKQGHSCAVYVGNDRTFNLVNESQAQQYINK